MSDVSNLKTSIVEGNDANGAVATKETASTIKRRKLMIILNVVFGSAIFMFVYLGSFPIATIQSSFNTDHGLGTVSLSVQTASMVVAALFFTTLVLQKVGLRRHILIGIVLETVYVAGNMYPRWWSLLPAAFVSGFGRPMLVTAQSIFIAKMAASYAKLLRVNADEIKSRFFTVFFSFYCSSRVIGNVVSSLILGSGIEKFSVAYIRSVIASANLTEVTFCGADFCESEHVWDSVYESKSNHNWNTTYNELNETSAPTSSIHSKHVENQRVYELCAFSFGCHALGFMLTLLLRMPDEESVEHGVVDSASVENKSVWKCLSNTIRSWKNPKYLLILPLSIYNGVDNAYWQADFTKSFVTCALGIHWIGFIVAWYGLSAPLTVMAFSPCHKAFFRPLRFIVAFAVHIGTAVVLLYWKPTVSELPVLFVLSAAWGVGSGLWPCCLSILYGIVFEDNLEAAFANMILFDSLGATASYAWSYGLCMATKTEIVIGLLSLGFLGYAAVELMTWLERRKVNQDTRLSDYDSSGATTLQLSMTSPVRSDQRS